MRGLKNKTSGEKVGPLEAEIYRSTRLRSARSLFCKGRSIRAAILNINISPIFKGRLILKPKKIRADT